MSERSETCRTSLAYSGTASSGQSSTVRFRPDPPLTIFGKSGRCTLVAAVFWVYREIQDTVTAVIARRRWQRERDCKRAAAFKSRDGAVSTRSGPSGEREAAPRHCPPIAVPLVDRSSRIQTADHVLQGQPVQPRGSGSASASPPCPHADSSALHLQKDGALEARVAMD